jgi:hypothetical protein
MEAEIGARLPSVKKYLELSSNERSKEDSFLRVLRRSIDPSVS